MYKKQCKRRLINFLILNLGFPMVGMRCDVVGLMKALMVTQAEVSFVALVLIMIGKLGWGDMQCL